MKSSAKKSAFELLALAAIVAALPTVLAHGGHDDGGAMDIDMGGKKDVSMGSSEDALNPESDPLTLSYFAYPEHAAAIYAHIALMVLGWVVVLPIGR